MAAETPVTPSVKPTIALVHGAFEDSRIWQGVQAKLAADGYPVLAVELPGRPGAPMSPDRVSLDLYRDTVLEALGSALSDGPDH